MSAFVISIDFELYWGVRDVIPISSYRDNLLGVREAIPTLLASFEKKAIHATWATVGMLFCATKRELERFAPTQIPRYRDRSLSPYDFGKVGADEKNDPFHFAPSLLDQIAKTQGQEIGSHTFSHFYCLEPGQTAEDFKADLHAAKAVAANRCLQLRSLVYPRNQHNPEYLSVLSECGFKTYRSQGSGWLHGAGRARENTLRRAIRLLDAYVSVSGAGAFKLPKPDPRGLVDVQASAFLRPYSTRRRHVEFLKLRRITEAMSYAARRGETFHLWWHPHNFGTDLHENMAGLSVILEHFEYLRRSHGMQSMTMLEAANAIA